MANTKASKKDILRNARNRSRNIAQRSQIKTLFKKLSKLKEEKDLQNCLNNLFSDLDKASEQVIHPKKASRLKSQAANKVKTLLLAANK